tara:strand:- start:31 stop:873 length:843 start_codon:yes stop_codon:yes gene_type:complete
MRVFKNAVRLVFIFYFIAIIGDQIYDKKQAEQKFLILSKNNLDRTIKSKRIILYGSSHCDYGLSAKKITQEVGIKTLNLCNYGVERKKYLEEFQNNLLNQLNENDLIVYSFRLNLEKIELEEDGILGLLLPQVRVAIISTFLQYFKKQKSFNEFGDRVNFPRSTKSFNYINYRIDYDVINNSIEEKIYKILNNKNLKSKVIVIITPVLIQSESEIDLEKIKFECLKNSCDKFVTWTQPLLIEDMKYFSTIGPRHFNPEKGRKLWTNNVIQTLKKNMRNNE